MSETKHTPEPWKVNQDGCGDLFISGSNAEHVTDCGGVDDDTFIANARRIVACVNACKGLSTERLESPGYNINDEFRYIALNYTDRQRAEVAILKAEADRDALLKPLIKYAACIVECNAPDEDAGEDIIDIIEKVTGKPWSKTYKDFKAGSEV